MFELPGILFSSRLYNSSRVVPQSIITLLAASTTHPGPAIHPPLPGNCSHSITMETRKKAYCCYGKHSHSRFTATTTQLLSRYFIPVTMAKTFKSHVALVTTQGLIRSHLAWKTLINKARSSKRKLFNEAKLLRKTLPQ